MAFTTSGEGIRSRMSVDLETEMLRRQRGESSGAGWRSDRRLEVDPDGVI